MRLRMEGVVRSSVAEYKLIHGDASSDSKHRDYTNQGTDVERAVPDSCCDDSNDQNKQREPCAHPTIIARLVRSDQHGALRSGSGEAGGHTNSHHWSLLHVRVTAAYRSMVSAVLRKTVGSRIRADGVLRDSKSGISAEG